MNIAKPAVQLALLPPSTEGDAASTSGRLVVEGPCLYLERSGKDRIIPAFMTPHTRWDGDELVVGSKRFSVGQLVTLGGSEINAKIADLAWVQHPQPQCLGPNYWITVSIDPA